jgi:hypothetical protein
MRVSPHQLQHVEKPSLAQSIAIANEYDFRDSPANENASPAARGLDAGANHPPAARSRDLSPILRCAPPQGDHPPDAPTITSRSRRATPEALARASVCLRSRVEQPGLSRSVVYSDWLWRSRRGSIGRSSPAPPRLSQIQKSCGRAPGEGRSLGRKHGLWVAALFAVWLVTPAIVGAHWLSYGFLAVAVFLVASVVMGSKPQLVSQPGVTDAVTRSITFATSLFFSICALVFLALITVRAGVRLWG